MPSDVGHVNASTASVSSHAPDDGSDCRSAGSGDTPVDHGDDDDEQVRRTPFKDTSTTTMLLCGTTVSKGGVARASSGGISVVDLLEFSACDASKNDRL